MKIKKFIIIFGLLFISFLSCGDTDDRKGFYATIRIVNADGSQADTYKFVDPDASGTTGGVANTLAFDAMQKSYQNQNNKDSIGFTQSANNIKVHIPPEGLKIPISMQREQLVSVFVFYFENYDNPPDSSEQMVASYESDSYLIINSYEYIDKGQLLLVGSVKCALILKDESRRIINGDFSIPIEEVL